MLVDEERAEAAEWRNFQADRQAETRSILFDRFRDFAESVSKNEWHRISDLGLGSDDCEQLAYEALIQSIDRFDPSLDVPFTAFARQRIRGAIKNAIPKANDANAAYHARKRAQRDRLASLKQAATAQLSDDPIERLRELVVGMALGIVLEDTSDERIKQIPSKAPSAYDSAAWRQMTYEIEHKLANLPEQERLVLDYHYKQGVRFVEIAALLGLSRGRISQIHAKALSRLRHSLSKFR